MPLFFLSLEPGSDTYFYQETLYLSESCRRRLRKTASCACLQGWPLKFVKHIADATGVPPSPAGPPGSCAPHLLHLSNLSFMIGMQGRRRRYSWSGHGRTTFLAENGFGRTLFRPIISRIYRPFPTKLRQISATCVWQDKSSEKKLSGFMVYK